MRSAGVGDEPTVDVEVQLALHTVKRAIWIAPILLAIFWLTRGLDGLIGASIGVGVVVANFLVSGWLLSIGARLGLSAYHAAALFGFFLRLGLLTLTMVIVTQVMELDRVAFGIATVVAYLVLLAWETVAVSRGAERELEWIN